MSAAAANGIAADLRTEFRRETVKRTVLTVFAILAAFLALFAFLFAYWVNTGGLAALANAATKPELAAANARIAELEASLKGSRDEIAGFASVTGALTTIRSDLAAATTDIEAIEAAMKNASNGQATSVAAAKAEIEALKAALSGSGGFGTIRATDQTALSTAIPPGWLNTDPPTTETVVCPPGEYIVAIQGVTYGYAFWRARYWCRKVLPQ